jgi:hypothetical protein
MHLLNHVTLNYFGKNDGNILYNQMAAAATTESKEEQ